jgi:Uma2 family endonuclease
MAETGLKQMTPEEFFQWQLDQEDRYELVDGFPVKMETGASERHDRVVVNTIAGLHAQLRGTRCRPVTADVAVRTRIKGVRRPDITVTCGEARDDSYQAQEPKMLAEVLSPSNSGVAWQRKLEEYRRLQGLPYILLVDARRPQATLLQRSANEWEPVDADGLDAAFDLPAIGCRLAMRDIYEGVTFEEAGRRGG